MATFEGKKELDIPLPTSVETLLAYAKELALEITSDTEHVNCPDCAPAPAQELETLFLMGTKNNLQFLQTLLKWAETKIMYARCAVCPPPVVAAVLYSTGNCDHKFCSDCMWLRNILPGSRCSCCVCDVQVTAEEIQIDHVHTNLGKKLQRFNMVVKKLIIIENSKKSTL
ncbi:unnamed protein product [Orchesella dallaii]|uniref:RING-type domain-containing protein n=1 Tax=Orchesella dallaii TaxID=48710 RepID=A0ABP1PY85_9HEXA